MKKVNLGCGSNRPAGWENYDADVDISKRLPFDDNSVDYLLAEHVLEHITAHEGFRFMQEISRVLKPGGVVKIIVPDLAKIYAHKDHPYFGSYLAYLKQMGWGGEDLLSALVCMTFLHGHQSLWTEPLLISILASTGISAKESQIYESEYPELAEAPGHWKTTQALVPWTDGRLINWIDNTAVEGVKL